MKQVKVLFVCMGNICRSPTAHGVFQQLVTKAGLDGSINVESAGTIGYHVGEHPDSRAMAMAKSRGVDISNLVARKVTTEDYQQQSFILAMDYDNLRNMQVECPEHLQDKIELLLSYHSDETLNEVPDPYYGGSDGFKNVYQMVELACSNLLDHIRLKHQLDN